MNNLKQRTMEAHKTWRGKIEITSRVSLENTDELTIAYTPGVAEPCMAIYDNPELSFELTRRWNTVAIITDGTAILGFISFAKLAASVAVMVYVPPIGKKATSHLTPLLSLVISVSPAI